MTHPAYVVVALSAAELETVRARTSGLALLYQGDALGLARHFLDFSPGSTFAVLAVPDPIALPELDELLGGELLRLDAQAAELEAEMARFRARLPALPADADAADPLADRVAETAALLEVCIHDYLRPLRAALRQGACREPR